MVQIQKKFTVDQIKVLFKSYENGHISRTEIENTLGIGKTRFFALLKQHRDDPDSFSIDYQRQCKSRLSDETEEKIRKELQPDKQLVENNELPISNYNYAAVTDRLKKAGIQVSTTTVIKRAIQQNCYLPKRKKKERHDREVVTSATGDLIQHDASIHKWSPFATEKWTLITSLDDFSRMMMYAEFVESETSWAHIQAAQYLMQTFGIPNRYYVDNLRIFRFIQHRDSVWKNMVLGTDDVNTQWRQVLALIKTDVIYTLSPQAKGKIERTYRWLQDRIVRTCALEQISSLADAAQFYAKSSIVTIISKSIPLPTKSLYFVLKRLAKKTGHSFVLLCFLLLLLPLKISFVFATNVLLTVTVKFLSPVILSKSPVLIPGLTSIYTLSLTKPKIWLKSAFGFLVS